MRSFRAAKEERPSHRKSVASERTEQLEHTGHEHPAHAGAGIAELQREAGGNERRDRKRARHEHHSARVFRDRFWVCLALTVPVLLLSPHVQSALNLEALRFTGDEYVVFALSSAIFFYGGLPFLQGFTEEVRARSPGMMTLISVAITVAYAYSAAVVLRLTGSPEMVIFWELATLIDVMLLGHWIEMRSVGGATSALQDLVRMLPAEAHLLEGGRSRDVPVADLKPGDRIIVRPGERVAVDGHVARGETSVDESMLTGESVPVGKRPGAKVMAGSVNSEGAVDVIAEKTGSETYLARMIDLVEEARRSRSRSQALADRSAMVLTAIAIIGGGVTLGAWLAAGRGFDYAVTRAVAVMVIACPHALGLAVPLVVAVSTSLAARRGLLVRDREAFERGRSVDVVIFDKTGTLTNARFGVTDVIPMDGTSSSELLALAASVESGSEHPVARAIVREAAQRQIRVPASGSFRSIPGRGAVASVGGSEVMVVSPGHAAAAAGVIDERAAGLKEQGKTVVFVIDRGRAAGAIALADMVRPESREAIEKLERMDVRCMMLTGDNRQVAARVADELGVEEYFAEVMPHEKSRKVREVKSRGLVVAMVGDGVNDAPALLEADLGIAIGAGTDVAVESADVVLVRNDPRDVVPVLELAGRTYRKMAENLAWAAGYNVFALPAAAGAFVSLGIILTPALGAVFMSVSTVIVAINARLLRMKG